MRRILAHHTRIPKPQRTLTQFEAPGERRAGWPNTRRRSDWTILGHNPARAGGLRPLPLIACPLADMAASAGHLQQNLASELKYPSGPAPYMPAAAGAVHARRGTSNG